MPHSDTFMATFISHSGTEVPKWTSSHPITGKEGTVLTKKNEDKKKSIFFMLLFMCSVFEDFEWCRMFKQPTHNPEADSTTTS